MAASGPVESLFSDPVVRAFIDAAPRHLSYSQLAARCRRAFGRRRAWSADRIMAYTLKTGPLLGGNRFKFQGDREVQVFVEGHLGRLTFEELADTCRHRFGRDRAPSRAALSRYAAFLRALLAPS